MFDAYLEQRAENKLDELPTYVFEECAAVDKCYPRGFYGVDKIGRPIYLDCTGKIDINALFRAASEDVLMRDRFMIYERVTKLYTLSCSALYDR